MLFEASDGGGGEVCGIAFLLCALGQGGALLKNVMQEDRKGKERLHFPEEHHTRYVLATKRILPVARTTYNAMIITAKLWAKKEEEEVRVNDLV